MKPDPHKLKECTYRGVPSKKRNSNYLSQLSPCTADICKSLRQLTYSKTKWIWNATYQKLFDKAKSIITSIISFYDKTQPLYLETDVSGFELRAALLQSRSSTSCATDKAPDNSILKPLAFASKSLSSAERRYSNIEIEALGILYGLKNSITTNL